MFKKCSFISTVHGAWSTWSNFTSCDVTCGTGVQLRTRTCTDPTPQYGGVLCRGDVEERVECENNECNGKIFTLWKMIDEMFIISPHGGEELL